MEEVPLVEARQRSVEVDLEALVKVEEPESVDGEKDGCLGAFSWFCSKFR